MPKSTREYLQRCQNYQATGQIEKLEIASPA